MNTSLDYIKSNRNTNAKRKAGCGMQTLMRIRESEGAELYDWLRVSCRSWSCGFCGPIRAFLLRKAIEEKSRELCLTRFLTLTLEPSRVPAGMDSVKYLRGRVWAKFRTYLKRKFGKPIQYISVLEFTKAGVPHLHVLVDRYIRQEWISRCWDALGGGQIVFIKEVSEIDRMARYLGKYLTKDAILSCPSGVKRWTASRGIKLIQKPESSEWMYLQNTFDLLRRTGHWSVVSEEHDAQGMLKCFTTTRNLLEPQREAWEEQTEEDWVV